MTTNEKDLVLDILSKLVAFESVTPNAAGSLDYIKELLIPHNFTFLEKRFNDVDNVYAVSGEGKNLCFVGHVDVVPPGSIDSWYSNPYKVLYRDNKIYGRGLVDMKGSIAVFLAALINLNYTWKKSALSILLTSNEEGPGKDGVASMLKYMFLDCKNKYKIDAALVGEPTSTNKVGDVVKIGRRGVVHCTIKIKGKQGHSAYPHLALNPIYCATALLQDLDRKLDKGTDFFDPSTMEAVGITLASKMVRNVIPEEVIINLNLRISDIWNPEKLKNYFDAKINQHVVDKGYKYELDLNHSADPFQTKSFEFGESIKKVIEELGTKCQFSTGGGTSDAPHVAKYCDNVAELGLLNKTAHHVNEYSTEEDIMMLYKIYKQLIINHFSS